VPVPKRPPPDGLATPPPELWPKSLPVEVCACPKRLPPPLPELWPKMLPAPPELWLDPLKMLPPPELWPNTLPAAADPLKMLLLLLLPPLPEIWPKILPPESGL